MRMKMTKYCKPGERLGKSIMNDNGAVLLYEGVMLTERMIKKLEASGVPFIYVEDSRVSEVNIEDVIDPVKRVEGIKFVKKTFERVQKDFGSAEKAVGENVNQFKEIVDGIFDDLRGNNKALNLVSSMQAYDNYVFTHSFNVMVYATQIAMNMGLSETRVRDIGLGALLHDVGKMMIPESVLNKPGKLDDDEFAMVREHSEVGYEILRKQFEIPLTSAHCAFQHHERLDGTGYPRGLKGDDIHIYGKILGPVDVFEAVTGKRAYREPMAPSDAMELVYADAGTKFDVKIVDVMKRSISLYPEGSEVELVDGRKGVVVEYDKNYVGRPVVKVLEEEGKSLDEGYVVDMRKELSVMIGKSSGILQ